MTEIIGKKGNKYIIRDTIFTIPGKKVLNILGMPVNFSLSEIFFYYYYLICGSLEYK